MFVGPINKLNIARKAVRVVGFDIDVTVEVRVCPGKPR